MTNAEARFNKIHIRKVYACLAVTCHLHFWQNDRDFLRATVVTRGWNGYRNKSQHRKSTLEEKILPPFQQGFEPATFQSQVRCSNHWAIPAPLWGCTSGGVYVPCITLLACQVRHTIGDWSLLCLYEIFWALIKSLVCWFLGSSAVLHIELIKLKCSFWFCEML